LSSAASRTASRELASQVRGLILLRFVVMTIYALLLWGAARIGSLGVSPLPPLGLLAGVWALTLLYWMGVRVGISLGFLVGVQIVLDVVLTSILVAGTGASSSPFVILYFLTIVTAGMLRERRGAILAAVGSVLSFAGIVVFDPTREAGGRVFYEIGVHGGAFLLLGILSGLLATRSRKSREDLESATEELHRVLTSTDRILEIMPIGLVTASRDGRVLRWNRAALKILGFPPEGSLEGRDVRGVFGAVAPRLVEALDAALSTQKWAIRDEIVLETGAEERAIGVSVTPLIEDGQGSHGVVVTLTDLREVRRLEREMMRSEQLAALGELAAHVAHEIRNPLASISGAVQMLRADAKLAGQEVELMDLILRESDRLNRIIDGVLDYTRDHSLSKDVHDLKTTVQDVVRLVQHDRELTKGKTILIEFPESQTFKAFVEEGGMKQVFFNLTRNALEAMGAGGILRITGEHSGDGRIHVVFRDTGVGIEPQELEHVFKPFHTSKPGGTGLGLSIASRIVEGNGGIIRIRSTPGTGTAITVELPTGIPRSSGEALAPKEESRARKLEVVR
jgi:two-component system sensor histidine kinase PilS (NtrC family)